jgi:hypothetical protein
MRPHHTLVVQPTKKKDGSAGQRERENDGDPVNVRGTYHPLSADEVKLWGDSERETGKFFCKSWPGDLYSVITFRGSVWDQVAAEVFDIGSSTKHIEVVIRRR